jgi:serine palmitoyltransferase
MVWCGHEADDRACRVADMDSLENVLRNAIAEGQPRTHRPWKKILVRRVAYPRALGPLVGLTVALVLRCR